MAGALGFGVGGRGRGRGRGRSSSVCVRERDKVLGHEGVGDDRDHQRVERRAQDGVLFAGVADADDMVDVAEGELEQLVGEDAGGVGKAKERVVGEDGAQAHGARMQDGLVAQVAEAAVAVDDVDLLADDNVAEHGEEGEDGGEGRGAVDDEKWHIVHLDAVGQVAHALAVGVFVRDDDDFVAAIDELARDLVDVALDTPRLRKEEVADHGDVVRASRHGGRGVVSTGAKRLGCPKKFTMLRCQLCYGSCLLSKRSRERDYTASTHILLWDPRMINDSRLNSMDTPYI